MHGVSANSDAVRGDATKPGKAGVYGSNNNGCGVHGKSTGSDGVKGESTSGIGVYGSCSGTSDPVIEYGVLGSHGGGGTGVNGRSGSGTGVEGNSNTGTGVKGTSSETGVHGHSRDGLGVLGSSSHSSGVKGTGKPGVYGISPRNNGSGVKGEGDAPGSIGLYGVNTPDRRALRTKGRVQMDTARKVTLSNRSNLVTLPTGVQAGAFAIVLAMVQGASGNGAFVRRAWRVDDKHIRITFDKTPANPTAVGYWVVQTG